MSGGDNRGPAWFLEAARQAEQEGNVERAAQYRQEAQQSLARRSHGRTISWWLRAMAYAVVIAIIGKVVWFVTMWAALGYEKAVEMRSFGVSNDLVLRVVGELTPVVLVYVILIVGYYAVHSPLGRALHAVGHWGWDRPPSNNDRPRGGKAP